MNLLEQFEAEINGLYEGSPPDYTDVPSGESNRMRSQALVDYLTSNGIEGVRAGQGGSSYVLLKASTGDHIIHTNIVAKKFVPHWPVTKRVAYSIKLQGDKRSGYDLDDYYSKEDLLKELKRVIK